MDRARLTPIDVLVLLHAADAEATVMKLAERLDRRPADIRRAAGRLVARGLLRRRRNRTAPWGLVFAATASGRDVVASLEARSSSAGAGDAAGRRPAHHDRQHRRPVSTMIASNGTPSAPSTAEPTSARTTAP
jgi:DNA-binding MarR family transcriptional regulator